MHDPDECPRFRWRIVLWGLTTIVLVPILWIVAAGPIWWRVYHTYGKRSRLAAYDDSLAPLYRSPELTKVMVAYRDWWERLPPPRSWERQYLVDDIVEHRLIAESLRAALPQREAELTALTLRLDALSAQASSSPEEKGEAIHLTRRLDEISYQRGDSGARVLNISLKDISDIETRLHELQQTLRQFDAQ